MNFTHHRMFNTSSERVRESLAHGLLVFLMCALGGRPRVGALERHGGTTDQLTCRWSNDGTNVPWGRGRASAHGASGLGCVRSVSQRQCLFTTNIRSNTGYGFSTRSTVLVSSVPYPTGLRPPASRRASEPFPFLAVREMYRTTRTRSPLAFRDS